MLSKIFLTASIALGAFFPSTVQAGAFCGMASHYGHGDGYHGRRAADGSRFNAYGLSTAARWLPFGTLLRVTASNGRSVVVRVTDRGPYAGRRVLDLSYGAFAAIARPSQGVVRVCAVPV